jgi:hypothetical protein
MRKEISLSHLYCHAVHPLPVYGAVAARAAETSVICALQNAKI